MQRPIFTLLLFAAFVGRSNTGLEKSISCYIDSSLEANSVIWANVEEDLLLLAQQYKEKSIQKFLAKIREGKDHSFDEQFGLVNPGQFKALTSLSACSDSILSDLLTLTFDKAASMGIWETPGNHVDLALTLHEMHYWTLNTYAPWATAGLLNQLKQELEDPELEHKLCMIVLVSKLYHHDAYIREHDLAEERSSAINLDSTRKGNFVFKSDTLVISNDETAKLDLPETDPVFLGGDVGLGTYIMRNVRYPEIAREEGQQGSVYVQFIINADGSVSEVTALNNPGNEITKEAIRVVESMPAWKPGMQNGEYVRVRFTLPINFRIAG